VMLMHLYRPRMLSDLFSKCSTLKGGAFQTVRLPLRKEKIMRSKRIGSSVRLSLSSSHRM
jgi:hypothetical protein